MQQRQIETAVEWSGWRKTQDDPSGYPIGAAHSGAKPSVGDGAEDRDRTGDRSITSRVLCQLSYFG